MPPAASALSLRARLVVDGAERDPHSTIERATSLAADARAAGDDRALAQVLRALGIAQRLLGDIAASSETLEEAVECSQHVGDANLEADALTSRAGNHFLKGSNDACDSDLATAIEIARGASLAYALFQQATIANRRGEHDSARAGYDRALELALESGAAKYEAHIRANRGLYFAYDGELDAADADLAIAREIYERLELTSYAAVATHNLGFLAMQRGEFTECLTYFEMAREQYARLEQPRGPLALDECEALLHVGLAAEASRRAHIAIEELTKHGNEIELAEATLLAAVADLHRGRLEEASRQAERSLAAFTEQRRKGWSEAAQLLNLRVDAAAGRLDSHHVDEAFSLVETFRSTGHRVQQSHAELLAARALAATGKTDEALRTIKALRSTAAGLPVEISLHAAAIEAEALVRARRLGDAGAAVDAGVELLERQHLALGATDVRASVTTHATHLFTVARRMALDSGDAAVLFNRVEQSRANSLRHRPATLADERSAHLLAELRLLTARLRDEPMDATVDDAGDAAGLHAEMVRLEQELTDHQWQSVGDQLAARSVATATEVAAALEDQAIAVLADIDEELVAIVMVGGHARLVRLGPIQPILDCAIGITMTLQRLARHVVTEVRAVAEMDLLTTLGLQLDALIIRPLHIDAEQTWVLVPPARLHQTAWCTSPTLRCTAFTVVPSATVWMRAGSAGVTGATRRVLVAGPRLAHGHDEVTRLGATMPDAVVLAGDDASPERVLPAVDGARLAHVAAHYVARRGNPMLSSIQLAGGDLYLQDIAGLAAAPEVMVLSTCDSAAAAVRAGDEVVGIGAALLQLGTKTVVATSNVLPDVAETVEFVARFHEAMDGGRPPSSALVDARASLADDDAVSVSVAAAFTCLGQG